LEPERDVAGGDIARRGGTRVLGRFVKKRGRHKQGRRAGKLTQGGKEGRWKREDREVDNRLVVHRNH